MKKRSKIGGILIDYLVMTLGVLFVTIAWECFMIPNGMSAGGLMGLCAVIEYATGGAIIASYSFTVINIALIVVAVLAFGIAFGFRTLYCIGMQALALKLFANFDFLQAVPGNFLYVHDRVMIPVISGVLEAVGIGLTIRKGGSTGGTDIIALMVNKYWPVSLSRMFLVTDFIIITSILFLPGKVFGDMVYGYIMMAAYACVIDFVVVGDRGAVQLLVFSSKYKEIADYINTKMERGVTVLKAIGWYTKQEKDVLLLLMRRNEVPEVSKVIKELDEKAFMTVNSVGGVYGEGFEEIKAGITGRKKKKDDKQD
ncbi:MAG: YitT family protein [Bacteroidales bacterium]|nr:YitT family protein [Bacteroidales bacterium]